MLRLRSARRYSAHRHCFEDETGESDAAPPWGVVAGNLCGETEPESGSLVGVGDESSSQTLDELSAVTF